MIINQMVDDYLPIGGSKFWLYMGAQVMGDDWVLDRALIWLFL